MTTLLVILGCITAYLTVGVFYGRSQYLRLWTSHRDKHLRGYPLLTEEHWWSGVAKASVTWRIFLWPLAIFIDIASGPLARWFAAPLTQRQEQAAQLRADADAWREKQRIGTAAEREMAAELARICAERADEVDP